MLYITRNGHVDAERVQVKIFANIERGTLGAVNGIVVHQTGGSTAASTFSSYSKPGANGAHFLIDLDGTIYQTASLHRATHHVGVMKSRCVVRQKCAPVEFKRMNALEKAWKPSEISRQEYRKGFPDRFPANVDSIGIEMVGASRAVAGQREKIFDPVSDSQNTSLRWLVRELSETLGVSMSEIYRHPEISRKTPTEASTAKW